MESKKLSLLKRNLILNQVGGKIVNSLFAFYLFHLVTLLPIILTPMVADDFAGFLSTGSKLDLNLSIPYNWLLVWNSMPNSTHINVMGQFVSILWTKFWILMSINLSIPAYIGFYLMKAILLTMFAIQLARLLQRVISISLRNSLKLVFLIMPLFLTAHFPWSNDPITGLPLAGLFSFIIAIQAIIALFDLFRLRNFFGCVSSTIWLSLAIFSYEINFSLFFVYVYLFFINRSAISDDFKSPQLSSHRHKQLVFVFLPFFIVLFMVFLANSNWGLQRETYGGTSLSVDSPSKYLEALAVNSFSTFSPAVWIRGLQLTSLQPWVLLVLITICLYLYFRLENLFRLDSVRMKGQEGFQILWCLLVWAFFGTAIQTLSHKIQENASFVGYVYLFHISQVAVLIITYVVLVILKGRHNKWHRLIACLSVAIFFMNTTSNVHVNIWGQTFFRQNTLLLSALTSNSENHERCKLLANWESRENPRYYKILVREGVDQISLEYRNAIYCESKRIS